MDYVILMDVLQSIEDLQIYIDGLLEREHLVWLLVLEVVQIAHVAVLHHQKVPFPFCVRVVVPSKVLSSLTMLG